MPTVTTSPSVLIRAARGSDGLALARLAELDSAAVPAGELIVAEADGALVAARSLSTGRAIADPFHPTADVLELLAVRATTMAAREAGGGRIRGVAARLGLRAARVVSHPA